MNYSKLKRIIFDNFRDRNHDYFFNPIPAGVLENQDMMGGGNLTPPSKSHVLCLNMTNDTSLESSYALLLESAKDCSNLQKLKLLL